MPNLWLQDTQQQDVYHWRLHVSLILNEVVGRLGRLEAQPPS